MHELLVVISAHSLLDVEDLQQLVSQEASPGIEVEIFSTATPGRMFIVLTAPLRGSGLRDAGQREAGQREAGQREAGQQLVLERFASNIAHSPGTFGLTEAIVGRLS